MTRRASSTENLMSSGPHGARVGENASSERADRLVVADQRHGEEGTDVERAQACADAVLRRCVEDRSSSPHRTCGRVTRRECERSAERGIGELRLAAGVHVTRAGQVEMIVVDQEDRARVGDVGQHRVQQCLES